MKRNLLAILLVAAIAGVNAGAQTFERSPFYTERAKQQQRQTIQSPQQNAAEYFHIGYCTNKIPVEGNGLGLKNGGDAVCLIKLPAAMLVSYVGDSICALQIGTCAELSNVTAVIRETSEGVNIASKTFNSVDGWNEIRFNKGVIIQANKDYYVGYSVTLPPAVYGLGYTETDATSDACLLKVNLGAFEDYTVILAPCPFGHYYKETKRIFPTN